MWAWYIEGVLRYLVDEVFWAAFSNKLLAVGERPCTPSWVSVECVGLLQRSRAIAPVIDRTPVRNALLSRFSAPYIVPHNVPLSTFCYACARRSEYLAVRLEHTALVTPAEGATFGYTGFPKEKHRPVARPVWRGEARLVDYNSRGVSSILLKRSLEKREPPYVVAPSRRCWDARSMVNDSSMHKS